MVNILIFATLKEIPIASMAFTYKIIGEHVFGHVLDDHRNRSRCSRIGRQKCRTAYSMFSLIYKIHKTMSSKMTQTESTTEI